jgi:hypothetical protein
MIRACKSKYGSFKAYISQFKFKEARNQHECEAIAQAVDAFLAAGVPPSCIGHEILLRRMAGVQHADKSKQWHVCQSLEWEPAGELLVPRHELKRAFKDSEVFARLQNQSANAAYRSTTPHSSTPRSNHSASASGSVSGSSSTAATRPFKPQFSSPAQSAERKSAESGK